MSNPEYINHYYRDDEELSYDKWMELFKADLDKEAEEHTWNIRSAVWTDYGNGKDCYLNGHIYKTRTDYVYDTAKDLLIDMMCEGNQYELLKAIESLSKEEAEMFVRHINRAKKNEQKFILKDNEEY